MNASTRSVRPHPARRLALAAGLLFALGSGVAFASASPASATHVKIGGLGGTQDPCNPVGPLCDPIPTRLPLAP